MTRSERNALFPEIYLNAPLAVRCPYNILKKTFDQQRVVPLIVGSEFSIAWPFKTYVSTLWPAAGQADCSYFFYLESLIDLATLALPRIARAFLRLSSSIKIFLTHSLCILFPPVYMITSF